MLPGAVAEAREQQREAVGQLLRPGAGEVEHVGRGLQRVAAPQVGPLVQRAIDRVGARADGRRVLGAREQHGAGGEVLGPGQPPVVLLHRLVDALEAADVAHVDRGAAEHAAQHQHGEDLVDAAASQAEGAEHGARALDLGEEGLGFVAVFDHLRGDQHAHRGVDGVEPAELRAQGCVLLVGGGGQQLGVARGGDQADGGEAQRDVIGVPLAFAGEGGVDLREAGQRIDGRGDARVIVAAKRHAPPYLRPARRASARAMHEDLVHRRQRPGSTGA